MNKKTALPLLLLLACSLPLEAWARIKLITLPVRERVEIRLEHADATLVEEERVVPLVRGVNQVDFSWNNTEVDPDSVLFRLLGEQADLGAEVLAVSYPPNENALIWSISAQASGSARVRISYLIGGLDKSYHYRAVAAKDESSLTLSHYLRVKNQANEAYDGALIHTAFGPVLERPLGLAETKDLLLQRHPQAPIRKRYTADLAEHGYLDAAQKKLRIPMHYVLRNNAAHGLGDSALPFGKARIFQQDGKGGAAFVGEDWARFTPRDSELALFLGVARDISVKRTIQRNERERVNGDLYHLDVVLQYEMENFKPAPVTLDLAEDLRRVRAELGAASGRAVEWELGPDTTLAGQPDPERSTAERLVFHVDLPGRKPSGEARKVEHQLHLRFKNEW